MSNIKHYFNNMIVFQHSLGYELKYLDFTLEELDSFYDEYYPELDTLTKESAEEWIYHTKSQSRHVLSQRVATIKRLGTY